MMLDIRVDAAALRPVIDQAVDAAVARAMAERKTDSAGRILLSKNEAADALGVSAATIDRLRRNARLPAVVLDGRILFRPESLREWSASRETAGETSDG